MRLVSKPDFLVTLSLLILTSCYYDKADILYPGESTCVPVSNPAFTANVLPILNTRCNNCHAGSSPSAGIKLTSYLEVSRYITSGSLIGSIKHTSGYSAMPKNGGSLPACEIQIIQDWITAGALNN